MISYIQFAPILFRNATGKFCSPKINEFPGKFGGLPSVAQRNLMTVERRMAAKGSRLWRDRVELYPATGGTLTRGAK